MTKISLTAEQRLNVEALIASQRAEPVEVFVLGDIRDKIRLAGDDRDRCMKTLPNGAIIPDEKALADIPAIEVELEKEELKKLKDIVFGWKQYGVGDIGWMKPLRQALEEAVKAL